MHTQATVIASGNLATSLRTVNGVLGQLMLLDISTGNALQLFTGAGLPAKALEDPDFPISLNQELDICLALARSPVCIPSPACALFKVRYKMGIENLGALGMAMRHAPTAIDALKVCLNYPQLTWGHSRIVVYSRGDSTLFTFSMERPGLRDATAADADLLLEYCLVLDLLTTLRNIEDIAAFSPGALSIALPFAQPDGWEEIGDQLPYPVQFCAAEACLTVSAAFDITPLPRANRHLYRSYASIAQQLAQMLGDDCNLRERVSRWLWAYTPPPPKSVLASMLNMSTRKLSRQLAIERTSYSALLAEVQLERAKNFLRNPALSIGEISERLGYSESAAFSRAFTGWAGLSPLKWRQQRAPTAAGE